MWLGGELCFNAQQEFSDESKCFALLGVLFSIISLLQLMCIVVENEADIEAFKDYQPAVGEAAPPTTAKVPRHLVLVHVL